MLFELNDKELAKLKETTFESQKIGERDSLQRLLRDQIEIVSPDTLVLDEEFSNWEDSGRRIDLLGLRKDGSLVVIELKRTQDAGHAELQALRYASMINSMTFEQGVDTLERYIKRRGLTGRAEDIIKDHLDEPELIEEAFASTVSIVLVSAGFSKEITTTVLWLRELSLDIRCVQVRPYVRDSGEVLVDVRQLIPLPEASEFQTGVAIKRARERAERVQHQEMPLYRERYRRFWAAFLERAIPEHQWLEGAEPSYAFWQANKPFSYGIDIKSNQYRVTWNSRGNREEWETIIANRAAIEEMLGNDLYWRDSVKPQLAKEVAFEDALKDENNWPTVHAAMIATAHEFISALESIGVAPVKRAPRDLPGGNHK